jgi:ketosteroid isomerase-like protein
MQNTNIERVYKAVDAGNRQDFEALPDIFGADLEYRESPEWPHARVCTGLEAFAEYFSRAFDQMGQGLRTSVEGVIDGGDRVLAFLRTRGSAPDGRSRVDVPFLAIYAFRDGRCVRLEGFLDPAKAEEAWGSPIGHPRQPRPGE